MATTDHMTLQCFHDVSLTEKAKAIERWGVALTTTEILGVRFMLYAMNSYFVEITIASSTCEILSINGTVEPTVMDLYLERIDISDATRVLNRPYN
jgi:hypothetical protein